MPTSQKSEPTMVSVTTTNTLQPSVEDRRGHKRAMGGRNVSYSLKTSAYIGAMVQDQKSYRACRTGT